MGEGNENERTEWVNEETIQEESNEAVRARPVKGPRMLQASGKHQYSRTRRVTGLGRRCGAAGVSGQVREREAAREGQGEKRAWSGIRGVAGLEEFLAGETGLPG